MRRSNKERSDATRTTLLGAARSLFIANSYAETATPEIVTAAGVTRGALYHHFEDKKALFKAVVERESADLAEEVRSVAADAETPRDALIAGAAAYFAAMAVPGRTRLLLIDGPAVLGLAGMREIDKANAEESLREGLADLLSSSGGGEVQIATLTNLLSAAFDRAALEIEAGGDRADYEAAIARLVDSLTRR